MEDGLWAAAWAAIVRITEAVFFWSRRLLVQAMTIDRRPFPGVTVLGRGRTLGTTDEHGFCRVAWYPSLCSFYNNELLEARNAERDAWVTQVPVARGQRQLVVTLRHVQQRAKCRPGSGSRRLVGRRRGRGDSGEPCR